MNISQACAPLNPHEAITVGDPLQHKPLHPLIHSHDMIFCLPAAACTLAGRMLCTRNHGLRLAAIAHESIEVLPHRRHGVVLAAGRGVKTDDSEEALAWGERRRPPITL